MAEYQPGGYRTGFEDDEPRYGREYGGRAPQTADRDGGLRNAAPYGTQAPYASRYGAAPYGGPGYRDERPWQERGTDYGAGAGAWNTTAYAPQNTHAAPWGTAGQAPRADWHEGRRYPDYTQPIGQTFAEPGRRGVTQAIRRTQDFGAYGSPSYDRRDGPRVIGSRTYGPY
jgi:hypothetical protein